MEHCRIHVYTKQKWPDERQISPMSSADQSPNFRFEKLILDLPVYKFRSKMYFGGENICQDQLLEGDE